jgi:hypothetical protein
VSGTLWVTHDCDPKDIVLAAGQEYCCDRASRMLVQALEDADLTLLEMPPRSGR